MQFFVDQAIMSLLPILYDRRECRPLSPFLRLSRRLHAKRSRQSLRRCQSQPRRYCLGFRSRYGQPIVRPSSIGYTIKRSTHSKKFAKPFARTSEKAIPLCPTARSSYTSTSVSTLIPTLPSLATTTKTADNLTCKVLDMFERCVSKSSKFGKMLFQDVAGEKEWRKIAALRSLAGYSGLPLGITFKYEDENHGRFGHFRAVQLARKRHCSFCQPLQRCTYCPQLLSCSRYRTFGYPLHPKHPLQSCS